jgi:hypothetical protein
MNARHRCTYTKRPDLARTNDTKGRVNRQHLHTASQDARTACTRQEQPDGSQAPRRPHKAVSIACVGVGATTCDQDTHTYRTRESVTLSGTCATTMDTAADRLRARRAVQEPRPHGCKKSESRTAFRASISAPMGPDGGSTYRRGSTYAGYSGPAG